MKVIQTDNLKEFSFSKAIKKPIPIKCVQLDEPFEVQTMEGTLRGKKG